MRIQTSINWTDQCCTLTTLTISISNECIKWWPIASHDQIISYCLSRVDPCQAILMQQLVTPCVDARTCVSVCVGEILGRKRETVFILHVGMWWDISLSTKTAPQNSFSPGCQNGYKYAHTHRRTLLMPFAPRVNTPMLCVVVSVCMCVSDSVTSLCHCGLKAFQFKSKHCSKYEREAEEQKQRHTRSQTGRIQCDRGRAS